MSIFLTHAVVVTVFIGSERYSNNRNVISRAVNRLQSRIGVPSGPQLLRLLVTHPEQCPETAWLLSLCVFACGMVFLLLFLSTGMFSDIVVVPLSGIKSPKRKKTATSEGGCSDDESAQLVTDDADSDGKRSQLRKNLSIEGNSFSSENDFISMEDRFVERVEESLTRNSSSRHANYSPLGIVVSYVVGAVMIDAILSFILPMHSLGYSRDGRPPCRVFEQRFHLMGYGHEYVDTVLIIVNILCHLATFQSPGKVHRITSLVLTALTYVLAWVTVECCYLTFAIKIGITVLSWEYAIPKLAPYFEKLIYNQ